MLAFLSGEILVKWRPNGGGVVLARSIWVTTWLYAVVVVLREVLHPDSTLRFSGHQLALALLTTLPWFGAIFAAIYTGFYTRFASQWTYLAGLYNQIMATKVQLEKDSDRPAQDALDAWEAGFIEDAEEVHLATKPMYAGVILSMLERQGVRNFYEQWTPGGRARLADLERRVKDAFDKAHRKRVKRLRAHDLGQASKT